MKAGYRTGRDWLQGLFQENAHPSCRINRQLPHLIVREVAVREALGRWVSELEPALQFDHHGRFAGLACAADPYGVIHVRIRGGKSI